MAALAAVGVWELLGTAALAQQVLPETLGTMPILSKSQLMALRQHAGADVRASGWPSRRPTTVVSDTLPPYTRYNQGLLFDLPTLGYYSSNQPVVTRDALGGMGAMLDMNGRMLRESFSRESSDTALRIILGVAGGLPAGTVTLPLARTLPASTAPRTTNVFTNRNAMLARPVYTPTRYTVGGRTPDMLGLPRRSTTVVGLSCAAGLTPVLQFSSFTGIASTLTGASSTSQGPVQHLSKAVVVEFPAGTTRVRLTTRVRSQIQGAACLDMVKLTQQATSTPTPVMSVRPNHIAARFASPQNGVVTFVVPRLDGWSCQADGRRAATESRMGFLAVPVQGASTVSCTYREPGVRAGVLLSVLVALVAAGLGVLDWRRGRAPHRGSDVGDTGEEPR